MLKNYLKIAVKVLIRRKFFTAISLFGVGFTLTVLLVVAALVDNVLSPQAPESNLDRTLHVYQMVRHGTEGEHRWSYVHAPGYALLDRYLRDIPGVEKMSIVSGTSSASSFVGGEKIASTLRHADGPYWEILDFDFLEGGPFTAADEESGNPVAVISESTRRQFFGEEPALNRTIELDGRPFQVVGVVASVPPTRRAASAEIWVPHSSARSQEFRQETGSAFYFGQGFLGLLLAGSRSDFGRIKAEFKSRLENVQFENPTHSVVGVPVSRLEQYALDMAPGRPEDGSPPVGQVSLILLAMVVAFLLLPTVNLISVNLSRFLERSGEIGIRRAFGASQVHLVGQFIFENVFLCGLGGVIALVAAAILLEIIESSGLIPHAELTLNWRVYLYALGLACFFGLISGAYPAWRTSRLHPVQALRGGIR